MKKTLRQHQAEGERRILRRLWLAAFLFSVGVALTVTIYVASNTPLAP